MEEIANEREKRKILGAAVLTLTGICAMPLTAQAYEKNDFIGTWYGLEKGWQLDFDDTLMNLDQGDTSWSSIWDVEGDKIITFGMNGSSDLFEISEEDGVLQLEGVIRDNQDTFVKKEDFPMEQLFVGEVADTDLLEMTLTGVGFSDSLENQFATAGKSAVTADDGMTFFCAAFHVKNISKEEKDFKNYFSDYILNYNDGFEFTTTGDSTCYCAASNEKYGYEFTGNGSEGDNPKLAPLTEMDIIVAIPCAKVVSEDKESPLNLVVTLPNSNGSSKFEYSLIGTPASAAEE